MLNKTKRFISIISAMGFLFASTQFIKNLADETGGVQVSGIPKNIFAFKEDLGTTLDHASESGGSIKSDSGTKQYINFGSFPQSLAAETRLNSRLPRNIGNSFSFNNKNFKIEPIKWIILENKSDKLFVMSKYILDMKPFDTEAEDANSNCLGTGWGDCSLNKWLNSEAFAGEESYKTQILTSDRFGSEEGFLNKAFGPSGKNIISTELVEYVNFTSQTIGLSDSYHSSTQKIFLVSGIPNFLQSSLSSVKSEILETQFGLNSTAAKLEKTDYASEFILTLERDKVKENFYNLRNTGHYNANAEYCEVASVNSADGSISLTDFDMYAGVVPACKIKLDDVQFASIVDISDTTSEVPDDGGHGMFLRFKPKQGSPLSKTKIFNLNSKINYENVPEDSNLVMLATIVIDGKTYKTRKYVKPLDADTGEFDPYTLLKEMIPNVSEETVSNSKLLEHYEWIEKTETDGLIYSTNIANPKFDKVDLSTGVRVVVPKGILPENSVLKVERTASKSNEGVFEIIGLDTPNEVEHVDYYYIRIFYPDGTEVTNFAPDTIEIHLPVQNHMDKNELEIRYIKEGTDEHFNGKFEKYNDKDYYKISTNHLSGYALIDKLTENDKKQATVPSTGDILFKFIPQNLKFI
ncbi:MAG: hypothetical protein RsTaC01_0513 [Candidatus Paraimprobicoccus trichonymphae]|uniref:DUF6273 domain-containing protein n=1 Tax=Candidatus Paraimprobicoccus trichonymphae TaxID=3033793 RepID=A0AA48I9P0_9FIRM|nr:MAG: hypothetical protein RsTaC01_0513 [Candidatus Paraimprobicoccus trichonymphae]